MPPDLRYVALSHCWGKIDGKVVLTHKNLRSWKRALPSLGTLKTFTDAIMITLAMNVNYIWIDCLCIIQDSQDDWIHEAALMRDVYENAYCTVAAAAAKSDMEGCFISSGKNQGSMSYPRLGAHDPNVLTRLRFVLSDDRVRIGSNKTRPIIKSGCPSAISECYGETVRSYVERSMGRSYIFRAQSKSLGCARGDCPGKISYQHLTAIISVYFRREFYILLRTRSSGNVMCFILARPFRTAYIRH